MLWPRPDNKVVPEAMSIERSSSCDIGGLRLIKAGCTLALVRRPDGRGGDARKWRCPSGRAIHGSHLDSGCDPRGPGHSPGHRRDCTFGRADADTDTDTDELTRDGEPRPAGGPRPVRRPEVCAVRPGTARAGRARRKVPRRGGVPKGRGSDTVVVAAPPCRADQGTRRALTMDSVSRRSGATRQSGPCVPGIRRCPPDQPVGSPENGTAPANGAMVTLDVDRAPRVNPSDRATTPPN